MTIQLKTNLTDKVIELGGGSHPLVRPNVDVRICHDEQGNRTVDFTADFHEPLPIQSDEWDGVYSQFVIEHIAYPKVSQFIAEILRILKPGGKAVIVTANTEAQLKWALDHPEGWDGKDLFESASCKLFGDQRHGEREGDKNYGHDSHKAYFSPVILTKLFEDAGFVGLRLTPYGARDTDIVVEAVKPGAKGAVAEEKRELVPNTLNVLAGTSEKMWVPSIGGQGIEFLPADEAVTISAEKAEAFKTEWRSATHPHAVRPHGPGSKAFEEYQKKKEEEQTIQLIEEEPTPYSGDEPVFDKEGRPIPVHAEPVTLSEEGAEILKQIQDPDSSVGMVLDASPSSRDLMIQEEAKRIAEETFASLPPDPEMVAEYEQRKKEAEERLRERHGPDVEIRWEKHFGGEVPLVTSPKIKEMMAKARDAAQPVYEPIHLEAPKPLGVLVADEVDESDMRTVKWNKEQSAHLRARLAPTLPVTVDLETKERLEEKALQEINSELPLFEPVHLEAKKSEVKIRIRPDSPWGSPTVTPSPEEIERLRKAQTEAHIQAMEQSLLHRSPLYQPEKLFDRAYFNGGAYKPFYWDFPCHELTARHVLSRKPESVLELGCGRGYVLKRLQDAGVPATGIDVSRHCTMTRVADNFITTDITKTPWPSFVVKTADLCFSIAVLDHIPEEFLPAVFAEMERTCKRGLHGVNFGPQGDDKTRVTIHPKEWWQLRLPRGHEVVDKNELEAGQFPEDVFRGDGKVKLNLGCAQTMFHHGWTNIDIHDLGQWAQGHGYQYQRHDLRNGIPWGTGDVSLIYCGHMLEHLTYKEGLTFLRECRRVIKPDGAIRIIVPDAALLMNKMYWGGEGDNLSKNPHGLDEFDEVNEGCANAPTAAGKLWSLLMEGHQAIYDKQTLTNFVTGAGFNAFRTEFRTVNGSRHEATKQILRETLDTHPALSLYVDAVPRVG